MNPTSSFAAPRAGRFSLPGVFSRRTKTHRARSQRSAAAHPMIEAVEPRVLLSFSNWSAIGPAIAKVPTSAGQLSSVSVVNFGSTVYTGPLNVKNTLDRIRANNGPDRSDDGIVYNNSSGDLPSGHGTWYEFTVEPAGGTNINFANSPYNVASPGPMRILLAADGDTYFTGDHYSTFKLVYDPTTAATPTIGSFILSPTSVTVGGTFSLTASNVTETGGTISSVKFYRESNGTSGLQTSGDTLVGSGTQSGTTWTLSNASTTGLAAGTYTYYAVATDSTGKSSNASSGTLTVTNPVTSGSVLAWNVTGQTNFGTQGLAATTKATGVSNSLGLMRGSGVSTSGTAASNAWGGSNWASTSSAGISGNQFVTFGATVASGSSLSLGALDLNYRRSSSGPASGYWQYQVNGGTWTAIGDFSNEFSSTSSSGAAITEINLAGISALQNLAAGTVVNFRVVPYGSSSSGGTWYVYDMSGDDLVLKGSIGAGAAKAQPAAAVSPLLITTATPFSSTALGPNALILSDGSSLL